MNAIDVRKGRMQMQMTGHFHFRVYPNSAESHLRHSGGQ